MSKKPSYIGKALLLEIRPIPMILDMLLTFLGAVIGNLATGIKYPVLLIYMADVATILYLAHLTDTFNDILRKEYQEGYKPRWGFDTLDSTKINSLTWSYLLGLMATLSVAEALSVILTFETGLPFVIFPAIGIVLALSYGSGLDKVPIISDVAWGLGVVFAFYGGFYVVTRTLDFPGVGLAILPILIGLKIFDAEPDFEIDGKLGKKTIPTLLGVKQAHATAIILILLGNGLLLATLPKPALFAIPLLALTIATLVSIRLTATKALQSLALVIIFFLVWAIVGLS